MHPRLLLLALLLIPVHAAADAFTYNVQMAGYPFERFDEKGSTSHGRFIAAFRAFPWMQQVGRSNGGSEPTLTVKNDTRKTALWVSIAGSPDDHAYIVGYIHPKETTAPFGLGTRKTIRWMELYVVPTAPLVESLYKSFFDGKYEQLHRQLQQLHKIEEMEPRI